jgi:hypothetical protein
MTGQDVINLVRYQLKDFQDVATSPFDKWNAINAGNRFVRRVALDVKPSILNATETGNLVAGTSEYTLTKVPNKITEVRVDGKIMVKTEVQSIVDLSTTGTPTHYYMTAYNKFAVWPIPDAVLAYSVRMVEASTDWNEATTIPWNTDIIDVIVAYAVGVLSGTGDPAAIRLETRKLLVGIEESVTMVNSYWKTMPETEW